MTMTRGLVQVGEEHPAVAVLLLRGGALGTGGSTLLGYGKMSPEITKYLDI